MKNAFFVQGIGLVGTLLMLVSYQCRSVRTMFRVQLLSNFCYAIHLILLGAILGSISSILNACRSYCLCGKWEFGRSKAMCIIICLLQIVALILTWSGWISSLPVVANVVVTIGGYTNNTRIIRLVGLCVTFPMWFTYDILIGSLAGMIDDIMSVSSIMISIRRMSTERKTQEAGWSSCSQDYLHTEGSESKQ